MIALIFAMQMAFAQAPAEIPRSLRVTIDPGHGGVDAGTVAGKLREADIVLAVAKKLKEKFEGDSRFSASLTRTDDVKVSLPERVKKAEIQKADIFVSLHANSSTDPRARGMEVYVQNHLPADEDTLMLAAIENQKEILKEKSMQNQSLSKKSDVAMILEDLQRNSKVRSSYRLSRILSRKWPLNDRRSSRPIRQAPFYVITKTPATSVLVELGFLTHPNDRDLLSQPDVQDRVADGIYQGLIDYRTQVQSARSLKK